MSTASFQADAKVHLLAIRKALANRNAAVMVGAGFSRNAEGGHNLATWSQLSDALANELEPERKPGTFTPATASQLAEQYARVFSPTHLEQLIKRCIPDDQVMPGQLHTQLLELPWSEVFTTNYDTLLERAAESLLDASYFTVCTREDIPQSKILGRRRIVKLHGSFPSHRPFILTEEEYRTYPEQFAPFVNLVRQSLLENVFCLIGFSGDDPNFLHWLGWVRDMLDKHALPVYLFLAQEPTLGERKLYEARGVVPVVLPTPGKVATNDYYERYRALFAELAQPLANSPLDWGDFPFPTNTFQQNEEDDEQQLVQFMRQLPALKDYRSLYPGWLVAPKKIRARFHETAKWLDRTLHRNLLKPLALRRPTVILAILELYGWVQSVVLEPWSDTVAELGRTALLMRNDTSSSQLTPDEQTFLTLMGCADVATQRSTWISAGLALLTWARQGHWTIEYEEIRARLQSVAPKDETVQERLTYEGILLCLQRGDQSGAFRQVLAWRPESSDAYVHVLRGSLLAEVGEAAEALPVLERTIQVLRRQQRSRPGNPGLISQEAWACLIAHNVQRALAFTKPSPSNQSKQNKNEAESENFELRLNELGVRGYSASQELESLMAELNAEAQLPNTARKRRLNFDLGTSTPHALLLNSELSNKIIAGLVWLELIERTGLLPQTGNVSFCVDQMLQAAWWSRFADTPERSIGLLLRARRKKALEPQDSSLPPHRSGWLGRHEIAHFSNKWAAKLCAELIKQVYTELEGTHVFITPKSDTTFLLEIFSRLVIRVEDEATLIRWGTQLIELHHSTVVHTNSSLWDSLTQTLSRILEALPAPAQSLLIFQVFGLPLVPSAPGVRASEHELPQWLSFSKLLKHWVPDATERTETKLREIVQQLIQQLRKQPNEQVVRQAWGRLVALQTRKLIHDAEQKEISKILWANTGPERAPDIPGYLPGATFIWPTPRHNTASLQLNNFLNKPLRPLNSGGYMVVSYGTRSYDIGSKSAYLGMIAHIMSKATLTSAQIEKLIDAINEWLDEQLEDLVLDFKNEVLQSEIFEVIKHLDGMLTQCVNLLALRPRKAHVGTLLEKIATLDERLQALKFPRYYLGLALMRCEQRPIQALNDYLRPLIKALSADDVQFQWQAANAAYVLFKEEDSRFHAAAKMLFDTMVACIFAQSPTCMEQAMHLLAHLPAPTWGRNLDQKSLALLEIALEELMHKLSYERQAPADTMFDERVPRLRFQAFGLAHALIHTANVSSQAAQRWLDAAKDDPLPEVRFGRFKPVLAESL